MIKLKHVSKIYEDNIVVVDDLTLDIEKGEFVVLIGPSGCGKSTLLRMINGMDKPSIGWISLNGKNINKINRQKFKDSIGYVGQHTDLDSDLTIGKNLKLILRSQNLSKEEADTRTEELLNMVGMEPSKYMHRYPRQLSGGQQQRIGILQALAGKPNIILMDEPFSALDPITRKDLQDTMKKLHSKFKKTIILITHDIGEAFKLGNKIVLMKDGKIVQVDSPIGFLRNPAGRFVEEFIGLDYATRCVDTFTVEKATVATPVTVSPNMEFSLATQKMHKKRVRTLLVVEDDKTLIGVITAGDVKKYKDRPGRIGDIVKNDIPVISEGTSAKIAFETLFFDNARILPIVDDSKKLKGLITRASLAKQLYQTVWNHGNSYCMK